MAVGGRTGSLYLRRNFPTLESREHGGRRPVKCLGQKGEGTGGVGCSKRGPKDRAEGSSDLEPSHGLSQGTGLEGRGMPLALLEEFFSLSEELALSGWEPQRKSGHPTKR